MSKETAGGGRKAALEKRLPFLMKMIEEMDRKARYVYS